MTSSRSCSIASTAAACIAAKTAGSEFASKGMLRTAPTPSTSAFAVRRPLEMAVTAEMKTSFLNGAKREGFYCTARTLKLGRRLIYGVAECVNGDGTLLTHHTFTYARPDM